MATARDIVTRALRRATILGSTETPSGAELKDAVAALNDMMHSWRARSCDVLHSDYTANSTVAFFVPPRPNWVAHVEVAEGRLAKTLRALNYKGDWDADTNTPTLATGTGTRGDVYKVSVAGSTTLDGVTSWGLNDFLVFDGTNWLKGQPASAFIGGLAAMLAVRLAEEYGRGVTPIVARDAEEGWSLLLAQFMVPDQPTFDRGLSMMPSQRYVDRF
jgi:hypothetical protein